MEQMKLKAFAKINLGLDVVRRREDGYHEVRMVMQTIRLYDQIVIRKAGRRPGKQGEKIHITTNLHFLPTGEGNLVYKAAKLLMDEFEVGSGVRIDLKKFIPVAAGMAGGSTDAAAVLFGINKMFRLGLSTEQLMQRGVKIGADVPYCIMRGTALSEGIGEILSPLPPMPGCYVLIGKPGISVSTKAVYENLQLDRLQRHPDIDGIVEAISAGDLYGVAQRLENVLETVTCGEYPVIEQIKACMRKYGALNALMSGSGPTVFGLFDDRKKAETAYHKLKGMKLAKQVYLTTIYNNKR